MEKFTLVILAGGKSSRFGRDKSLLEIDGRRLVESTVERCRPIFDEIFISSNSEKKFALPGVRELSDTYAGMGPMGGIHSGLAASRNDAVFFAACDMPYFNTELALEIMRAAAGHDVCVPQNGEEVEPLFGVYRTGVAPLIESLLASGERSLRTLLLRAGAYRLDCAAWLREHGAENAFYNINYQGDFEKMRKPARGAN